MSERRAFWRKISYLMAIVVLLAIMPFLSMPASGGGSAGGKLSQLRNQYKLSQANLGEIDTASATMRLATLGLGNVAAIVLWQDANYYKKVEDWTRLTATCEQLSKIQPNFISVWQFQGWNLSYNVSVEFDDYKDRYYWVLRGVAFLREGLIHNEDNPKLLWDVGWTIGQKIGRSDEHVQFRKMFKVDADFHNPDGRKPGTEECDGWLVGREWFLKAEDAIDNKGKSLGQKSPLIFFSSAPMTLMNYAEAFEEDGAFGERAKKAWKNAFDAWVDYGKRSILTSFDYRITLNDAEARDADAKRYAAELEALAPGTKEAITQERRAALNDRERRALDLPEKERGEAEYRVLDEAQKKTFVGYSDIATRIGEKSPEHREEAMRLARQADKAEETASTIRRYRDIVNYSHWKLRSEFEQTPEALAAREQIAEGEKLLRGKADLVKSREKFEAGLKQWRAAIDRYPHILDEGILGDELVDVVVRYRDLVSEAGKRLPNDFILKAEVLKFDREGKLRGAFADETVVDPSRKSTGAPPEPEGE